MIHLDHTVYVLIFFYQCYSNVQSHRSCINVVIAVKHIEVVYVNHLF